MAKKNLTQELKLRIEESWKTTLEKIALSEGLSISDIGRRAIAEYLKKAKRRKLEAGV